ncbi:hypothetical protein ACDY99_30750, partial [Achromobacter dolens]|uniref:hypothetical protein n=1 Tax=Achromobacter dolens TaxID=1287738 RepID=UPI0035579872
ATMLLYQTHGAVTDFRGKLVLLAHKGSILSKVGASAKPGAIHQSSSPIASAAARPKMAAILTTI